METQTGTGWTGGQYSIYRGLLAFSIAYTFLSRVLPLREILESGIAAVMLPIAFASCVALAAGVLEGWAISLLLLLLGLGGTLIGDTPLLLPNLNALLFLGLLASHAAVNRSNDEPPFGAWAARGRADPAGHWRMPSWIPHAAWAALAATGLWIASEHLIDALLFQPDPSKGSRWPWIAGATGTAIECLGIAALFVPRWRATVWCVLALWHFALTTAFGAPSPAVPFWILHALALDPGWLPGRQPFASTPDSTQAQSPRLFYDGECGLCHRSVRILLAEEGASPSARALRFAPLQGKTFQTWAAKQSSQEIHVFPDSIILACEDGRVLMRSSAVIELACRLGGLWRAIGHAGEWLPEPFRDTLYDRIAAIRKLIFAEPKDSCPILPPDLRQRFDP